MPHTQFRLMTGGSCFTAWEAMLAEAEKEAKTHVELSQKLSQSVTNQLSEITARKRVLKKKVRTIKLATCAFMKSMISLETHKPLHHKYSKILVVVCSKVYQVFF